MRVIRSMQEMQTEQEVARWLRAVVMSCAYDQLRKDRRRTVREHAATPTSPEARDALEDRLDWLRSELAKLDPKISLLIALRFRFGWTLQRIGALLGMKPGAVDGRIRRGLEEISEKRTSDD